MKSISEMPGTRDWTILTQRMYRVWLGIVALSISTASPIMGQTGGNLPKISLELPLEVPSEAVQITYFMSGPFGGYGDFVRPEKKRLTYEIDASVGAVPASGIKLIAYLPGCEIVKIDIPTLQELTTRLLECRPLGTITLRGRILPTPLLHDGTEVEVSYLAMWDHEFFGIADGAVTTFHLARIRHDNKGYFEVQLPDLAEQGLGKGQFDFILRETSTGNIVSFLWLTGIGANSMGLEVSPSFPGPVQFIAKVR